MAAIGLKTSKWSIDFEYLERMTQRMHFKISSKTVRESLDKAVNLADEIRAKETELILSLYEIDQDRFYVRYGYKSLVGFCTHALRFTKTQSLRLAIAARRIESEGNIRRKEEEAKSFFSRVDGSPE